ncbi:MAG TPA: glycine--tRNA ligase subunit beta [Acidiphilium sp.]|nr:MAG: glycine--tRNA ligase subunit beta [Acidiphilium sp. 37-60-79]HQT87245.1 glycine--tRNA ligase subunit beta [Acidiphilium sp.]HQU23172.1 glycine--tRNA ligase subunit beta [Acidiphilium sp.]
MAEFFLEIFSEEIPARMQAEAAAELMRRMVAQLALLDPQDARVWYGPRRLAFAARIGSATAASDEDVRGPRVSAPGPALDGFLRKNAASRDDLVQEGEFYYLRRAIAPVTAAAVIGGAAFAASLAALPWPKSMRWGGSGAFSWVRPLRGVVCLLDGAVVPVVLGPVASGDQTEGHRFMAPGAFTVTSAAQWQADLQARYVIVDADERRRMIGEGLLAAAGEKGLSIVEDAGLLDEVTGLVEYPVVLIGAIEPSQMALPPEVRELSMKVNQRYFATRDAAGQPAPFFAFVANIAADDGGAAIIAGNERVLRARLADAEHFWNLDRQQALEDYLPRLQSVVFHAKLGTQLERAERIAGLAGRIAEALGADADHVQLAVQAGRLCKVDLVTGMVGEFPELQGIMGGYYADDPAVGAAISTHYQPKGPTDGVPEGEVACAVALADKIDTLREFFRIGETPTGSGDPYALRRAALGVIRIILENGLRVRLRALLENDAVFDFIIERLRVKLRGEGKRFDVLNAILAAADDDDLVRIAQRAEALERFIATETGDRLLQAYRRGANILRIEEAKDGPYQTEVIPDRFDGSNGAEAKLNERLNQIAQGFNVFAQENGFDFVLNELETLHAPVETFFNEVTVNAADPAVRRNRLRLLAKLRDVMHRVADFSKLEG